MVKAQDWHKLAIDLSINGGLNAREISNKVGVPYNTVRTYIRRWRNKHGMARDTAGRPKDLTSAKKEHYSYKDGVTTYEIEQAVTKDQEVDPQAIMKAKNLNPTEWTIISFTNNTWQSQTREGETVTLCQSKLVVKPKSQTEITFTDIDKFFEGYDFEKKLKKIPPFKYSSTDEVLEIDVTDPHLGLLSYSKETGSDCDLEITKTKFLQGIADIVERASHKKFKHIYLCALGDIIHIDNDKNTTAAGTPQDVDTRMSKVFDCAVETMKSAIEALLTLEAPITYIYTCGNHDRNTGYYLVKVLDSFYRYDSNVTFDISPNPQKAIHFGRVLVGLTHGDMAKKNHGAWLIADYRREFGESDFIEEHSGHIHTEEAKIINGIMCRSLTAQCGNSYWEHQQGYRSDRGIMSFVWNEVKGLRETWYYYY